MSRKIFILWFVLVPDLVLLYAALWLAVLVRYDAGLGGQVWGTHVRAFSVVYPVWLLVLFIHNVFEASAFRRYFVVFYKLLVAMAVNLLVAVTYFYFQPSLILTPRRFLLIHVGIALVLLLVWHLIVKYFLKSRLNEKLYIFSLAGELHELEQEIRRHDYLGYKVLGHVTEETLPRAQFDKNSGIILPDELHARPEILTRLYELRKVGVVFYNHKAFYEALLRRVYLSRVNQMWFLENVNYKEKRFYTLVKRAVDIFLGIVGLAVAVVTFPLVAALIKLTSPGPVLFIQKRVGQGGRIFSVYKYRTMKADNPANTWTSVRDPRITRFGRFLRISRVDEWPQFINLILGNMSLVGPRPEQPHLVEALRADIPFYDERHMVKPGITGWAQINNVYAATVEETRYKLQYDLYYIKHHSFLFDVEIILKSIYYVLSWQGR